MSAYAGKKLTSKKKQALKVVLITLLGVVSGVFLGLYYVTNFVGGFDYSNLSEQVLRDNEADIVSKYGNRDIATLSGVNAFIIAENKISKLDNVIMENSGYINAAGIKQNLYTKKYKVGSSYYVENISKGTDILGIDTNIAERNYYDANTDMLTVYKGSNVQESTATFGEVSEKLSLAQWKEKNGTTPLNFHPYIVSSKTINKETKPKQCTLDNGEKGYKISFSLKHYAALLYVKQIKNLSKLGDFPEFTFIELEVYLNSDGTFNKIDVNEEYKVKKAGMKVTTKSKISYKFSYEAKEIPLV